MFWVSLDLSSLLAISALLLTALLWIFRFRPTSTVLVVLGSGGHTSEMLRLLAGVGLADRENVRLHFVVADSDQASVKMARTMLGEKIDKVKISLIPRSREVGQSWPSSFLSSLIALVAACSLVVRVRPKLVVVNGPGTCVPVVLAGKVLGRDTKVLYVESFCRVRSLSLAAK